MAPDKSLEAVVWCAVGGRGNLLGPILGAIGCNALKSYATHSFAEQWPYILGGLFIFTTVFIPKGLIGLPGQFVALKKRWWPILKKKMAIPTKAARAQDASTTVGFTPATEE